MWIDDRATDAGAPIFFDAHDAMLDMSAEEFSNVSREILNGRGHDYDEVALKAGVVDRWLSGSDNATFLVDINADQFAAWLDSIGLSPTAAISMTKDQIDVLKTSILAQSEYQSEPRGMSI